MRERVCVCIAMCVYVYVHCCTIGCVFSRIYDNSNLVV